MDEPIKVENVLVDRARIFARFADSWKGYIKCMDAALEVPLFSWIPPAAMRMYGRGRK